MNKKGSSDWAAALGIAALAIVIGGSFIVYMVNESKINLPDFGSLGFYVGIIILTTTISLAITLKLAQMMSPSVYRFFDSRWLPKPDKTETYTTGPGERLEKVVVPSFWATTFWSLVTTILPAFIAADIIAGASGMIVMVMNGWNPLFGVIIIFPIKFILAWNYWIREWTRQHTKFVIFTEMTYYIRCRTPLLALLIGRITLPASSKTPISQIREIQISADPEDFDKTLKTGWLQDQFTGFLANRLGLRTIFLRSIFNRAEDILFWLEWGPGVAKILNTLVRRAADLAREADAVARKAVEIRYHGSETPSWTPTSGRERETQFRAKFRASHEPVVYDLYRVADPGLYDNNGDPTSSTANGQIGSAPVNVAQHFQPVLPSAPSAELVIEEPDPHLDQLPG